jgi:hypothetical protein
MEEKLTFKKVFLFLFRRPGIAFTALLLNATSHTRYGQCVYALTFCGSHSAISVRALQSDKVGGTTMCIPSCIAD